MLLREIISEYRKSHNLSQRAFAAKCNVTNGYMSMIEKGENPSTGKPLVPSFAKLKQLANGMDMTVNQLIQIADDMEIDISGEEFEGNDLNDLSSEAISFAYAFDKMSDYGKAIIRCVMEQEKKS